MPKNMPDRIIDSAYAQVKRTSALPGTAGATLNAGLTTLQVQDLIDLSLVNHRAESDPHTVYLTQAEGDALYSPLGHNHDSRYYTETESDSLFVKLATAGTIAARHTFNPGSAASPFVLGANAQNQLVSGLYADSVNKSISAGVGLTGGGALTANVTVSMGTPSSLSSSSGNSASGTTHTHVIDSTIARSNINIGVSGLGLSGGGDLTASRTITLASSSAPGAAASILASSASGQLTLPLFVASTSISTPSLITAAGDLSITPAGNNVTLASGKTLRSAYTSGWAGAGYQLDYNVTNASKSFLELDDISVRGTLKVYELLINQIRATNGTEIVSSAAKLASVSGSTWTFEDADGASLCPFAVDDILLIQRATVAAGTLIKRIVRKVATVSGATVTVGTATGGPADTGSPAKGDTVVRIGSETNANRRGTIVLTSDMSNSPYIDVISGVALWSDWGGAAKTKLRLGLLTGITSTANEYGLIAGSGYTATDSYIKISTSAVLQNNVPSTWKAGGVDFLNINGTNGISLQSFDATGGVITYGDQRIVGWSASLPSSSPDGALWTQYTATQNELHVEARQTGTRAGLIQLAAYGEAATGNYADTVLLTLSGAESAATRSYLNIRADDMEIDLGNGSANIGILTLYSKQLLFSDGSSSDDGSATNPAYSFLNDPDTGIYRSAANQLDFATGGVSRMSLTTSALSAFADSNAIVSLGRAKIGYINSDEAVFAHFDHLSSTNYGITHTALGRLLINAVSTQSIDFRLDNTIIAFIDSTGLQVGAAAAPTKTLDVNGNAYINQSSTTLADATLKLNQADVSEEFIDFNSTVATGNAINTDALGSYYGRVRVAVNGTFKWLALYS